MADWIIRKADEWVSKAKEKRNVCEEWGVKERKKNKEGEKTWEEELNGQTKEKESK